MRIPCHPKQPVVVLAEGAVEPSKGPVGVVARGVDQSDPKALFTGERPLSNCELPIRIAATSQRVQRKGAPSVPIPEVRFLLHLPECCGRLAPNEKHRTQQIVDLAVGRSEFQRLAIGALRRRQPAGAISRETGYYVVPGLEGIECDGAVEQLDRFVEALCANVTWNNCLRQFSV